MEILDGKLEDTSTLVGKIHTIKDTLSVNYPILVVEDFIQTLAEAN